MTNTLLTSTLSVNGIPSVLFCYGPYDNISDAVSAINAGYQAPFKIYAPKGLTVGIKTADGSILEWWVTNSVSRAVTASDLELKTPVKLTSDGFKVGDYVFTITE